MLFGTMFDSSVKVRAGSLARGAPLPTVVPYLGTAGPQWVVGSSMIY